MVGRGEITDVAWEQIEPLLGLDIRVLQSSARHGNTPRLTRNEQVNGSSPLVGSLYSLHWY